MLLQDKPNRLRRVQDKANLINKKTITSIEQKEEFQMFEQICLLPSPHSHTRWRQRTPRIRKQPACRPCSPHLQAMIDDRSRRPRLATLTRTRAEVRTLLRPMRWKLGEQETYAANVEVNMKDTGVQKKRFNSLKSAPRSSEHLISIHAPFHLTQPPRNSLLQALTQVGPHPGLLESTFAFRNATTSFQRTSTVD